MPFLALDILAALTYFLTTNRRRSNRSNCLLLTTDVGDPIAIKSGFGAGGTGSFCLSIALQLLEKHGACIDEIDVAEILFDRLDRLALTLSDLQWIEAAPPILPSRWWDYIREEHVEDARSGALWGQFAEIIPYGILDPRVVDLALTFRNDPDAALSRVYRRLEDHIRKRTGLGESGTRLFADAFAEGKGPLTWAASDKGERVGRRYLFEGAFMAFRNPRQHRERSPSNGVAEFLLLNQLFRLEREAIANETEATEKLTGPSGRVGNKP